MRTIETFSPISEQPTRTDIEELRARAINEANEAQAYKANHDNFDRQIETMLSDEAEKTIGSIALRLSTAASTEYTPPTDEN